MRGMISYSYNHPRSAISIHSSPVNINDHTSPNPSFHSPHPSSSAPHSSPTPPHPSPTPPHPLIPPPANTRHCSISPSEGVTILLKCPHLSSFSWCLRLYSMVCGGMGVIFSILWVVGQGYVLAQTEDTDLRAQRWAQLHFWYLT